MSGVVGILNFDGAPVERELLGRLASFLSFRGPDGQHAWCEGQAGLGHALLRTAGESEAGERQPCTIDGEAWIAADARIDAREELVAALELAGRRGVGEASDAALILHAYGAWGDECPARLLGDFAFAIWDVPRRRLFCARDQLGVRPFYYARAGSAGNTLVFSNTLEAVRLPPLVPGALNELFLADLLLFGRPRDPAHTAFEAIHSLPPAHALLCEAGDVRIKRYWSLPIEPVRFRRAGAYAERFTELLDTAVADRLRTPRAAILMSGGLDSSSIAASAVRGRPRPGARARTSLQAYTIVYEHLIPHDERRWAGRVAEHLGIPIEFVPVDGHRLYGSWNGERRTENGESGPGAASNGERGAAWCTPEPIDNPLWALPIGLARRIAGDGYRVVLSGEGGDASCAATHTLPELLATGRLWPLARDIAACWREQGRRPPLGIGEYVARRRKRLPRAGSDGFPGWLNPTLVQRLRLRERWADAMREDEEAGAPPGGGEAYRELRSSFWPWCVLQQDPGWTRMPIEARYPFFDLRLVSFLLGVPGVPWSRDKALLRAAARARLPRDVCDRPKTPLHADPVVVLLRRDGPPPVVDADGALWQFVDRPAFLRAWSADPSSAGWAREDVTRALSLGRWLASLSLHGNL